jgi:hypothetical protein
MLALQISGHAAIGKPESVIGEQLHSSNARK